jgi:DNA-binding response OmpR family regulator
MKPILMVDDDKEFVAMVREYLEPEGFQLEAAHDYESGLVAARTSGHELMILDVMLPGGSGFELLKQLRKQSPVPVLLLTGRGDAVDRIVGLEIGADDYLPKPCDPRELLARIRAILRRTRVAPETEDASDWIRSGDVELSPGLREVRCGQKILDVTSIEFNVLEQLMRNRGRVISRDELADAALGRKLGLLDRSIDVHVSRLRKKLAECANRGEYIKAVRGTGYIFVGYPDEERGT